MNFEKYIFFRFEKFRISTFSETKISMMKKYFSCRFFLATCIMSLESQKIIWSTLRCVQREMQTVFVDNFQRFSRFSHQIWINSKMSCKGVVKKKTLKSQAIFTTVLNVISLILLLCTSAAERDTDSLGISSLYL